MFFINIFEEYERKVTALIFKGTKKKLNIQTCTCNNHEFFIRRIFKVSEEDNLEDNLGRIDRIMKAKGIKLIKDKTKMMVSRYRNTNSLDFKISGVRIKDVREFQYIDSKMEDVRNAIRNNNNLFTVQIFTIYYNLIT